MPHLGIVHEDEKDVRPPVNNILSQSVADVKAGGDSRTFIMGGRTGPQPGGIISEISALPPTKPRGILARIGELPVEPREGEFIPRTVAQNLGLTPPPPEQRGQFIAREDIPSVATPTPTAGITPTITAPVLGEIDFSSISGLLKGVKTVTEFTRNLQKFNRARGISPGKRKVIKTSDIQKRITFLQEQLNEGLVPEEQETGITDELDILNQFIQSRLGVGATRASRAREDEQRRLDIEAIRAS